LVGKHVRDGFSVDRRQGGTTSKKTGEKKAKKVFHSSRLKASRVNLEHPRNEVDAEDIYGDTMGGEDLMGNRPIKS